MLFSDRLEARIAECGNPICLGMDPKLSLMPVERRHSQVHTPEDKIRFFYMDILEECEKRNVKPAVVKPNSAYYECVSIEGMRVLLDLIAAYKSAGIPVILDAKRGDIGKSSAAYADAAFRIYAADAVTVRPVTSTSSTASSGRTRRLMFLMFLSPYLLPGAPAPGFSNESFRSSGLGA